jgi:hypothetical protein
VLLIFDGKSGTSVVSEFFNSLWWLIMAAIQQHVTA